MTSTDGARSRDRRALLLAWPWPRALGPEHVLPRGREGRSPYVFAVMSLRALSRSRVRWAADHEARLRTQRPDRGLRQRRRDQPYTKHNLLGEYSPGPRNRQAEGGSSSRSGRRSADYTYQEGPRSRTGQEQHPLQHVRGATGVHQRHRQHSTDQLPRDPDITARFTTATAVVGPFRSLRGRQHQPRRSLVYRLAYASAR